MEQKAKSFICSFCGLGEKAEDICGKLYCLADKKLAAHQKCMQYSANLCQYTFESFGGFKIDDVLREKKRGRLLKCYICSKKNNARKLTGATCGCAVKSCGKSFHFYCARRCEGTITKRLVVRRTDGNRVVLYRVFCSKKHYDIYRKDTIQDSLEKLELEWYDAGKTVIESTDMNRSPNNDEQSTANDKQSSWNKRKIPVNKRTKRQLKEVKRCAMLQEKTKSEVLPKKKGKQIQNDNWDIQLDSSDHSDSIVLQSDEENKNILPYSDSNNNHSHQNSSEDSSNEMFPEQSHNYQEDSGNKMLSEQSHNYQEDSGNEMLSEQSHNYQEDSGNEMLSEQSYNYQEDSINEMFPEHSHNYQEDSGNEVLPEQSHCTNSSENQTKSCTHTNDFSKLHSLSSSDSDDSDLPDISEFLNFQKPYKVSPDTIQPAPDCLRNQEVSGSGQSPLEPILNKDSGNTHSPESSEKKGIDRAKNTQIHIGNLRRENKDVSIYKMATQVSNSSTNIERPNRSHIHVGTTQNNKKRKLSSFGSDKLQNKKANDVVSNTDGLSGRNVPGNKAAKQSCREPVAYVRLKNVFKENQISSGKEDIQTSVQDPINGSNCFGPSTSRFPIISKNLSSISKKKSDKSCRKVKIIPSKRKLTKQKIASKYAKLSKLHTNLVPKQKIASKYAKLSKLHTNLRPKKVAKIIKQTKYNLATDEDNLQEMQEIQSSEFLQPMPQEVLSDLPEEENFSNSEISLSSVMHRAECNASGENIFKSKKNKNSSRKRYVESENKTSEMPREDRQQQNSSVSDRNKASVKSDEYLLLIPVDLVAFQAVAMDVHRFEANLYSLDTDHVILWTKISPTSIPQDCMLFFIADIAMATSSGDWNQLQDLLMDGEKMQKKHFEYKQMVNFFNELGTKEKTEETMVKKVVDLMQGVKKKNSLDLGMYNYSHSVNYLTLVINNFTDPKHHFRDTLQKLQNSLFVWKQNTLTAVGKTLHNHKRLQCMKEEYEILKEWFQHCIKSINKVFVHALDEVLLVKLEIQEQKYFHRLQTIVKKLVDKRKHQDACLPAVVFLNQINKDIVSFDRYFEEFVKYYCTECKLRPFICVFPVANLMPAGISGMKELSLKAEVQFMTAFDPAENTVFLVVVKIEPHI